MRCGERISRNRLTIDRRDANRTEVVNPQDQSAKSRFSALDAMQDDHRVFLDPAIRSVNLPGPPILRPPAAKETPFVIDEPPLSM